VTTPSESDATGVRLTILVVVAGCLFGALFARLAFLQVVNAPTSQRIATDTGLRKIYTQAPRGNILDRNGQVLVGNRTSEVIEVQRQQATSDPTMKARLAALLGMTSKQLDVALNDSQYSPFAPVPVLRDAAPSQILYVQEHQSLFPGVKATTETLRSYTPAGKSAANIVGYVGAISSAEYARMKNQGVYQPGDQVGLSGVEAEYESILRGTPGIETVQVNAKGDVLGVVSTTPAGQGPNLKLTIDGNVQMAAESAVLAGQSAARGTYDGVTHRNFISPAGSAVVEDPKDGTVVALATNPVYDPTDFVGGISQAKYAAYRDPASNDPLLDRTIQGQYAPGSTFKLVTATAALQKNLVTPTSTYADNGKIKIGNQLFKNDQSASYGTINLQRAITVSSDIYFNQLGADFWNMRGTFGPDAFQNVARSYGFGSRLGVKLPNEFPGKIPDPASVAADYKAAPHAFETGSWYTGDSAQIAVGQFEDLVTPLQLANAYSTFANGGTTFVPRLALDTETPDGKVVATFTSQSKGSVPLAPDQRAAMVAGFTGVVNDPNGTAYGVFRGSPLSKMDIAGKTGTAQATPKQSTSVFTSFAPATNPTYEVTAFMEQSGYGASVAGPVVRQIYDKLYNLPPEPITSVATSPGQT
ncbi:MAG: penicillin-binding protein 2, partial [Actinomycetota bacterium]|nr:penicillin-binding protein 2 [Actinomycetota bacterium]